MTPSGQEGEQCCPKKLSLMLTGAIAGTDEERTRNTGPGASAESRERNFSAVLEGALLLGSQKLYSLKRSSAIEQGLSQNLLLSDSIHVGEGRP